MSCARLELHDKAYATISNNTITDNGMPSAVYHPSRRSILSVNTSSLQEIDVETGLLNGYESFDLSTAVYTAPILSEEKDKCTALDQIVPVGKSFLAAVYQSRYMVSWDLDEMVLYSFDELEKSQKNITALVASLDRDNMIFYTVEGSHSIKISSLEFGENTKKITSKTSSRNAIPITLAFCTLERFLCVGHTDGSIQLWNVQTGFITCTNKEESTVIYYFTQSLPSAVVSISFEGYRRGSIESETKQYMLYFAVAYRNTTIEVWEADISANSESSQDVNSSRIASTQMIANSSTAAADFSKKSGKLEFCWHLSSSLLLVHWLPQTGVELNHYVIAWDYKASMQSDMYPAFCSASSTIIKNGPSLLFWFQHRILLYTSFSQTSKIIELILSTYNSKSNNPTRLAQAIPLLSTNVSLTLNNYLNYRTVPIFFHNVCRMEDTFCLRRVSFQNGAIKEVERLLSWKTDEGKFLFPWRIVSNASQTAFCIELRVLGETSAKGNACRGNNSHYVTLSLHTDTKVEAVKYGSIFKAREVAFVTMKSDEKEKKTESSCLLVLDVAGKSLRYHEDHHDFAHSITLPKEIQRFFVTPLLSDSSNSSDHKLYHRLVCTAIDDSSNTELIFFEDELLEMSQDSYPHRHWRSEIAERVINVSWNKSELTGNSHGHHDSVSMAAVLTTDRIVILSEYLTSLARYSTPHSQIQSSLWMAQSLIVATREGHLRYLTPMVSAHNKQNDKKDMHLILSFAPGDMTAENGSENMCVQLVAAIGDRLIYTLTDPHTLVNRVVIRPWSLAEPIAAGYLSSNVFIKAIVEREILSFISDSTTDVVNPLTDKFLFVLFERFRWDQNLHILLRQFSSLENFTGGAEKNSRELSYKSADATTKTAVFGKSSRVCKRVMASIFSGFFDWRATVEQCIRHDPALIDYAFKMDLGDSNSSFFAKLPAKSSSVGCMYNAFGEFFVSIGCLELAVKCYDLAGNDQALLTLMIKLGGFQRFDKSCTGKGGSIKMLTGVLRSEWTRLYSKLSCISFLDALAKNHTTTSRLDSGHWQRHDCFSLLCCEQIFSNQERRTRLLPLSQASSFIMLHHKNEYETPALDSVRNEVTANILPWRRLSPGDCRDWIGKPLGSASAFDRNDEDTEVGNTVRLADEEPRNPRYEVLMQYQKDRETADNGEPETFLQSSETEYGATASQDAVPQVVKASIGPFLDDEDAVVAYWRFEEGNSILARIKNENEKEEIKLYDLDSLDMSKHENHLTIQSFGGLYDPDLGAETVFNCMTFAPSSSPVDKGEPGRVQEPFVLRFPSSDQYQDVYGAKCHVPSGSSLDLGLVFDEDPYRRKLTVECWIRKFGLAKVSRFSARNDDGDDIMGTSDMSPAPEMRDTLLRRLIGRSSNEGSVWWELYLDKAFLCLRYADQVLHSEFTVTHASAWQHFAFTIDIASYGNALGKVYIQGQLAGVKEFKSFDEMHQANLSNSESSNEKRMSFLWIGNSLENYEMTEIRIWATARSPEQLQDMKENYLGIAETKKKLKVAIHKRNCQCDKCIGYRKRKTGAIVAPENFRSPIKSGNSTLNEGKGYTNAGLCFPSTPPAAKSRERRWPHPTHSNVSM